MHQRESVTMKSLKTNSNVPFILSVWPDTKCPVDRCCFKRPITYPLRPNDNGKSLSFMQQQFTTTVNLNRFDFLITLKDEQPTCPGSTSTPFHPKAADLVQGEVVEEGRRRGREKEKTISAELFQAFHSVLAASSPTIRPERMDFS